MYVQNTSGGQKALKKKICFRVKSNYPESQLKLKTKNNICKTIIFFKKLTETLLKDKTKQVKCWKKGGNECKECYCVCCSQRRKKTAKSPTIPPTYR